MTNPQDFREQLPELLDEHAPKRAPGDLFARFADRMDDAPQRPGWATRERWLPMDSSIPFGRTQRVALLLGTLLLLALALATAFVAGSRLLATSATIIVAADGSGDVTTLGEGVAIARDGDIIVMEPGTYTEVVTISKDLKLLGAGAQGSVVIRATDDGPSMQTGLPASRPVVNQRYAILIDRAGPTLSGLTFMGQASAVVVIDGSPLIEGNLFEGVGLSQDFDGTGERTSEVVPGVNAIVIVGGSRATIRDNRVVDSGPIASYDLSEPTIEGNELTGGAHILGGFGDGAQIRNNRIEWADWGVEARGDAAPLIEANTITEVGLPIYVERGAASILGNHIEHGSSIDTGIQYHDGSGTIENNTVLGYARAVDVSDFDGAIKGNIIDSGFDGVTLTDSAGTIDGNQISAVFTGINLSRSSPDVVDNRIEGSARGVSVAGADSSPTFSGNELCGTTQAVATSDGATQPDLSGLADCAEGSQPAQP